MALPGDKISDIRRSEASLMTASITSLDVVDGIGDGGGDSLVLSKRSNSPKRNSQPEWEYAHEKVSNVIKDLKKAPELNSKTTYNFCIFAY